MSFPVLRALSLCTCCPQYPGAATGRRLRSSRPARNCSRVGLHIVLFEACSAFTRVAARTLAPSPICHQLPRRLQPFRHLHDCSGCFRLERSPGGTCTHWKAPPSLTAHAKSGRSWRDWGWLDSTLTGVSLLWGRKRQLSLLELDGRRQVQRANQRIVIARPRLKFRWLRHKKKNRPISNGSVRTVVSVTANRFISRQMKSRH